MFLFVKRASILTIVVMRFGIEKKGAICLGLIRIYLYRKSWVLATQALKNAFAFFPHYLLLEENNHNIWFNHEVWVLGNGMHTSVHRGMHSVMMIVMQSGIHFSQFPCILILPCFVKGLPSFWKTCSSLFSVTIWGMQECCLLWQASPISSVNVNSNMTVLLSVLLLFSRSAVSDSVWPPWISALNV